MFIFKRQSSTNYTIGGGGGGGSTGQHSVSIEQHAKPPHWRFARITKAVVVVSMLSSVLLLTAVFSAITGSVDDTIIWIKDRKKIIFIQRPMKIV